MDEPTQPAEPTAKARSRGFAGYVVWGFVIVVLYFLSAGPVALMLWKRTITTTGALTFISGFYTPWRLAYLHTPLHKPIGIYMHLWNPHVYDSAGDVNPRID